VTSGRDAATRRLTSVEEIWDLGVDLPLAGWRGECRGAIADAWNYAGHTIAWKRE
jgi:hypothetical protein